MEHQSSIKRDYKCDEPLQKDAKRNAHHHHLLLLAGALIGLGIVLGFTPDAAKAVRSESLSSVASDDGTAATPADLPPIAPDSSPDTAMVAEIATDQDMSSQDHGEWHKVTVKKGDNLALIFKKLGLKP